MLPAIKRAVYSVVKPEWYFTLGAIRQIRGEYEPIYQKFLEMVPRQGTMLDVGANIGITCGIAGKRRPDLHLIAFEPVPLNIKVLQRIRSLYSMKTMEVHPVAVGDHEGIVTIAIPKIDGREGLALCHVVSDEFNNPDVERYPFATVDVRICTLDSFQFGRVHAIKIDVEDHEYHVLQGARAMLERFHPIVFCELWDTPNRVKSIDLMSSFGYSIAFRDEMGFIFVAS
ncbi:FkbM family methyltransferase [Granulicella sp. L46]|uniref:FkbM family methyltransferase n=1 Tax=Granulicella sp. L46 TaxID=1641865 RepID=UPI00131DF309|nr:FkbM family methyltransferase [Granulicella sp. L46]